MNPAARVALATLLSEGSLERVPVDADVCRNLMRRLVRVAYGIVPGRGDAPNRLELRDEFSQVAGGGDGRAVVGRLTRVVLGCGRHPDPQLLAPHGPRPQRPQVRRPTDRRLPDLAVGVGEEPVGHVVGHRGACGWTPGRIGDRRREPASRLQANSRMVGRRLGQDEPRVVAVPDRAHQRTDLWRPRGAAGLVLAYGRQRHAPSVWGQVHVVAVTPEVLLPTPLLLPAAPKLGKRQMGGQEWGCGLCSRASTN